MKTIRLPLMTLIAVALVFQGCSTMKPSNSSPAITDPIKKQIVTPMVMKETATRTSTSVHTSTMTSTPKPTHTPTIVPTLSGDAAKKLILDQLVDHSCRLPCIAGLYPGKSDAGSVYGFFHQFGEIHDSSDGTETGSFFSDNKGHVYLVNIKESVYLLSSIGFSLDEESHRLRRLIITLRSMFSKQWDPLGQSPDLRPLYGGDTFNQEFHNYLLPAILSDYGPPTLVYMATWPIDPERMDVDYNYFSLVLFYPDQGIFAEYVMEREIQRSKFIGCPLKSEIHITTWSPEEKISFRDMASKAGSVINSLNIDYFRPIEQVTAMTLEDFYRIFKDPDNKSCIETPSELWKPY